MKFKLVIAYDGTATRAGRCRKPARACRKKSRRRWQNCFRAGRACTAPAARTPASMRSAWWRILKFPRAESKYCSQTRVGHQRLAAGGHSCALGVACNGKISRAVRRGRQTIPLFRLESPAMNPLLRHTAWHVTRPLDLKAMRAAATLFVGRHDFKSFAASRNYEMESTVRRLTRCDIKKIRRVIDVHHRRRRISLQNVPWHRWHDGASRAGQISTG